MSMVCLKLLIVLLSQVVVHGMYYVHGLKVVNATILVDVLSEGTAQDLLN